MSLFRVGDRVRVMFQNRHNADCFGHILSIYFATKNIPAACAYEVKADSGAHLRLSEDHLEFESPLDALAAVSRTIS